MRHIVDILRGANTRKIRDLGHTHLTTYGIGKDLSVDEWVRLGRALIQQGLLSETNDGYPVLKLNRLSVEILRKQLNVEIPSVPMHKEQTVSITSSHEPALEPEEIGLFQHLRNLRKQLADDQGVPPYVIFPDSSLRAMAKQRPQSEAQFAKIPGVGIHKQEVYFTQTIRIYCELHNLNVGNEPLNEVSEAKKEGISLTQKNAGSSTRQLTLDLYRQGRSIEEISNERNLKASTIISHLAELIESGEKVDVEDLIQPGHYESIVDALQQVGDEALKPVKDFLGDAYSYDEIKLVRSLLRRTYKR